MPAQSWKTHTGVALSAVMFLLAACGEARATLMLVPVDPTTMGALALTTGGPEAFTPLSRGPL
ncbi:MAG: hypothetical protein JO138_06185 [Acidobacteriaceae bacterium]|nr:hypothetical protein [Acidobacteriaceae bacterium]